MLPPLFKKKLFRFTLSQKDFITDEAVYFRILVRRPALLLMTDSDCAV